MAPFEPFLVFTIPSVHDNTVLDGRIYHPTRPRKSFAHNENQSGKIGAILAHPYAPLGGSYDDAVVQAAGEEVLERGVFLCTFNFRGAGDSKGRTSWTAKPELSDYISFVGFLMYYLHYLDSPPISPELEHENALQAPLSPIRSSLVVESYVKQNTSDIQLILGGYSYGSLISTYLPSIDSMLARFAKAKEGTAEAEIRLRAFRVATEFNMESKRAIESRRGRTPRASESTRSSSRPVVIGGEETNAAIRRPSQDTRRSRDSLRRSFDRGRSHCSRSISQAAGDSGSNTPIKASADGPPFPTPAVCYLLISPLLPPISGFLTFFSDIAGNGEAGQALIKQSTLAIYGDQDAFTTRRKYRRWAESMKAKSQSRFRFHEIARAGHFWHERGVETQLRNFVRLWLQDVIG